MKNMLFWPWVVALLYFLPTSIYASHDPSSTSGSFDMQHYHLACKIDPKVRRIGAVASIQFSTLESLQEIGLKLDTSFNIFRVEFRNYQLLYRKEGEQLLLRFPFKLRKGEGGLIKIFYGGSTTNTDPSQSFGWGQDRNGAPWVTANSTSFAWWPMKTGSRDLLDSLVLDIEVPSALRAIVNGGFEGEEKAMGGYRKYRWKVKDMQDPKQLSLFIGNYQVYSETYRGISQKFSIRYFVHANQRNSQKEHFYQLHGLIRAYEYYLGSFPLGKEGLTLVVVPKGENAFYPGTICYSGNYQNNDFDYDPLLAKQLAKIWFGYAITPDKREDAWIPIALASYMEALLIERQSGYLSALAWLKQFEANGTFSFRDFDGDVDAIAVKGALFFHTLRHCTNDDTFFDALQTFTESYKFHTVDTEELVRFFIGRMDRIYNPLFAHFIERQELPQLEYQFYRRNNRSEISFRWSTSTENFLMPIFAQVGSRKRKYLVSDQWQTFEEENIPEKNFRVLRETALFTVRKVRK